MGAIRRAGFLSVAVMTGAMLTAAPAHADNVTVAESAPPGGVWTPPDDVAPAAESSGAEWPSLPWQPDLDALLRSVETEEQGRAPAEGMDESSDIRARTVEDDNNTDDAAQRLDAPQADASESDSMTTTPMSVPAGVTVGAPGVGEQSWYSFQDFNLSASDVARVNIANGNLLVKATDLKVAAPGYGLSVERFYNSFSSRGSIGSGWNASNSYDIGLLRQQGYIDYYAPSGAVLRFVENGSGWTAPAGSNLTLKAPGNYELIDNRSGDVMTFNRSGYLVSAKDRSGSGLNFSTSRAFTRALAMEHTNGRSITPIPDGSTPGHSGYSNGSRQVMYARDSAGRLTTVTPPSGATEATTYTYDSAGRLASITVPGADAASGAMRTVTFTYDASSRIASVSEESGSQTLFAYSNGQTVVTDENGHTATFGVDAQGRVTSTKDSLNRSRSQTWTANSDVATTTDAIGSNVTTYTYDGSGNRTNAQLPTGAAASAVYAIGASCSAPNTGTAYQAKCSRDDAGNKKQYEYDAAGNLTKQTNTTASTPVTEFERTYENYYGSTCGAEAGQVCSSKDGNGNVTTYQYNAAGDLLKVIPPSPLGATTYTYDSVGRVTSVKDGNNATTTYQYDVRDRIVRTTFNNGQYLDQTYFPNGLAKTTTDSAGGAKSYAYDGEGRIIQQSGPQIGVAQTYTYDAVGNVLSFTDSSGTTNYTYDVANQLTTVKQAGGTCPASGSPAVGSGCVQFEYDQNALESKRLLPGGASTVTTRDNSGRPTRITAKAGNGTTAVDIGYSYTPTGSTGDRANVQTRTAYAEQGVTAGAVTSYTYESRNRLSLALEKSGSTTTASWGYSYDNAGNRTQQVRTGSTGVPAGTVNYTYNAANQLTAATGSIGSWSYDGAGNQTGNGSNSTQIAYGDRGEASSATFRPDRSTTSTTTPNDYFGTGNTDRLSSGTTTFASGALGLMQRTEGGATHTYTRTAAGIALGYKQSTSQYYYVQDHLGSVVGIFTASGAYSGGYSYGPYGEARATSTASPVAFNVLRYIGGLLDGGNVYKLGARYYDTTQGRFTQMDPSGQEKNPYGYASCNPINGKDPRGTRVEWLSDEDCSLLKNVSNGIVAAGAVIAVVGLGFDATIAGVPVGAALNAIGIGLAAGGSIDVFVIGLLCD